ncbi:YlmH/Sll1252 family protein [Alicyclobacillus sp.]|uniref:YlmH family RNA-binding protein n=1 Tax=Alicyclobacillus sp. TaxID=61169 RepID=UPI0025B97817|nr:YlmH/Sll1252 family protein [Alicyclobacillus sp.]MCL6515394.1 hypothetical protein [Alicyclobacillus sp.]
MTEASEGWVRPEERPFLRRARDWVEQVVARHSWRLTDFLTPREQYLLNALVRHEGLVVAFWGGGEGAERCRALVMPDDWYPQPEDFEVTLLEVRAEGSDALHHGSLLGSLLATGIDRRKVGDLAVDGTSATVALCADVAPFVQGTWRRAGRVPIAVEVLAEGGRLTPPRYAASTVNVASLRADAIIAQVCRWPRSRAQEAVAGGRVQLNFAPLTRADQSLFAGDLLSVRGFGRIRIGDVAGETRSGRVRLEVGVLRADA